MNQLRIGHGVDLHQLEAGRTCVIGGVEIASPLGPVAHSDGDVLLHALMDAILGAQGEGDIGVRFPNTEEKWRGASSLELLRTVWSESRARGWEIVNADLCVV
jgi:2-C-methyl-D-erythritol 2,4-cyclodiphosphate synthase